MNDDLRGTVKSNEESAAQMMAFLRERNAERAVQPATVPGQIPIWFRLLALPSSWYGFIGLAVCTYLVHPRWQGWIGSFLCFRT